MGLKRHHISEGEVLAREIAAASVGTEELKDSAVTEAKLADGSVSKAKLKSTSIQSGATDVSFGFTAVGVETITASVSFPTAFATAPTTIVITHDHPHLSLAVTAITASDFTISASDNKGTDYTASESVRVYWIAIE